MKYRIVGSTVPAVEIAMEAGESMYTQSGGMAWKTEGIEMSTSTRGGFLKGLGRMFSGESFFMATYKATKPGQIAFSTTVPGSVLPLSLDHVDSMTIQKGAFLCAQSTVSLEVTFTKKTQLRLFRRRRIYPPEAFRDRHGIPGSRWRCSGKNFGPRRSSVCRYRKCW